MRHSRLIAFKQELGILFGAKFAKTSYFGAFSIEMYRKKGQNHVSRFPDMFPRVPQPEIAYLASYHHPDEIVQKWRGVNFVKIKCFSDAAMVDCASDRINQIN